MREERSEYAREQRTALYKSDQLIKESVGEVMSLTPSLPGCRLKTTRKSAKFETLKPSSAFSHWHVKGFSSKLTALKADVTGPENVLFAGASVQVK